VYLYVLKLVRVLFRFFQLLTATLTSSNIQGASKCEFRFFWNMYGGDIGTLYVHVNIQNPEELGSRGKWNDSGGSESTVATRCTVTSINTKCCMELFSKLSL